MKTPFHKFLAVLMVWLACAMSAQASQLWFSAQQGTGTQYPSTIGSISIDNPTGAGGTWWTNPPASYISMGLYHDDTAMFFATVDTDYSANTYHIGQFMFGADCYLWLY